MSILDYWIDPCLEYWLVCIVNFWITILNFFTNLLFGYSVSYGTKDERKKAKDYEHSAQIVDIWGRGAYGTIINTRLQNFVWKHNRYVHPRYVLENDNVTLMGYTPTHAFFCVSDPGVDLVNPDFIPFMFIALFIGAKQLVIMPHESINRLAAEVGDPDDRDVCLIHMTARCGSTLLSQMFNLVPKTRVLSEPWALMHLQGFLNRKEINMQQFKQLSRSGIRVLCKKEVKNQYDKIIIKISPFCDAAIPLYLEMFPKFKVILNTRLLKSAMFSYVKVVKFLPSFYQKYPFMRFWFDHLPRPFEDRKWEEVANEYDFGSRKDAPQIEKLAFGTAGMYQSYLTNKSRYVGYVCYEDLTKKPKETTEKMFKSFDVPLEYVDKALKAMQSDSQAGTLGGRGNEGVLITEAEFAGIDRMLKEMNVPISSKMTLDELKKVLD